MLCRFLQHFILQWLHSLQKMEGVHFILYISINQVFLPKKKGSIVQLGKTTLWEKCVFFAIFSVTLQKLIFCLTYFPQNLWTLTPNKTKKLLNVYTTQQKILSKEPFHSPQKMPHTHPHKMLVEQCIFETEGQSIMQSTKIPGRLKYGFQGRMILVVLC